VTFESSLNIHFHLTIYELGVKLRALLKREIIEKMKSLDDYLKLMKTDDVVKATQEARTKNALLLNDQGISAIAILFSDVLVEVIKSPT